MPLGGILSAQPRAMVALRFDYRAIKPTQRLKIWLLTLYPGADKTGQIPWGAVSVFAGESIGRFRGIDLNGTTVPHELT
jgi:hypothetical protein